MRTESSTACSMFGSDTAVRVKGGTESRWEVRASLDSVTLASHCRMLGWMTIGSQDAWAFVNSRWQPRSRNDKGSSIPKRARRALLDSWVM